MDTDNSDAEMNWQTDTLPAKTAKAFDYLSRQEWMRQSQWYLAGGTALALQAGHRKSLDLDFFSQKEFFSQALVRRFSAKDLKPEIIREGTFYGKLLGAKISFIFYPFFLPAESPLFYGSVRVLRERDIAVMKIVAISQRGTKRDFVDLYWYCRNRELLIDVIRRLKRQYPLTEHNYHHLIKSLVYFEDAEADPMPQIFFQTDWREIKKFFNNEVPKAAREFLGLE